MNSQGVYTTAVNNEAMPFEDAILALDETIQNSFYFPSFADFWQEIDVWYRAMNFEDKIPDEKRIAEYKYIYEQLLKFVFKKQKDILNDQKDYSKMLREVENIRKDTDDTATERKVLVYQRVRNVWLDKLMENLVDINSLVEQHDKGGDDE